MANTTNYNWETPDDTDLVKDGAAAIRTLGTSIDTTTKNLNPQTTTGALAYRSATANVNTALPVGSTGQVLTVAGGVPTWATPTTGDIEGVTAGTGISGGGTSGTVTITNSMATEITAKADLIVGTGNATFDNLPVGANGTVLTADSTVSPTGLKWAAPSAGGAYTLLTSGSLTGASVTSASFSGTYTDLKIVVKQYQGTTDDTYMAIRFNSDSGTNYQFGNNNFNYNTSPNQTHIRTNVGVTNSGTSVSLSDINIPSYSDTSVWKFVSAWNVVKNTSGGAVGYGLYLGNWANTAAISTVTFFANTGNLNDGDYYIYGVK